MDVSVIIVNYNTCDLTRNCLKSVFEQTKDIDFEVIVSDNGSKDGSIDMIKNEFPQVILIENNANLGFGAANNRGLKKAKGKYIFYLNSDTIILNNAIKIFYDYWEQSPGKDQIGALGTNLLDDKERIIHSYGCFPKPIDTILRFAKQMFNAYVVYWFKKVIMNQKNYIKYIGNVDYITGADLFVRNNSYALFDERYFMYVEEVQLQYEMYKKKLYRMIIDGPRIIHLEGKSAKRTSIDSIEYFFTFSAMNNNLSTAKFIQYNYSKFHSTIMKLLLYLFWLTPGFIKKTKQFRREIWKF